MSPSPGNLLNQTQFKVAEFSPLREGEVVVAVVGKNDDWLFTGPNEDPSWQQTSGQWSLTTMGRIKLSTKFRFFTIFGVVKAATGAFTHRHLDKMSPTKIKILALSVIY